MNCPYCDETVHLMSKFCPKCGLPLKEDSTVMGAYASDDTGPGLGVIAGGAGAILAITLIIGWVTSQGGKKPVENVRRQPVSNPALSFNPASRAGMAPINPAFSFGGSPGSSRSANYRPNVKWAHVPPAHPTPRPQAPIEFEPTGPEAPPINLSVQMALEPKMPPKVEVARAETPPLPMGFGIRQPRDLGPGEVMAPQPVESAIFPVDPEAAARQNQIRELESQGAIVYDPVQERYVIVPERRRRPRTERGSGSGSRAPVARPSGTVTE
jgi:hypothetical protein